MERRLQPQENLTNHCCGSEGDKAAHSRQCFPFKHLLCVNAWFSCKMLIEMWDLLPWSRWF